LIGGIISSIARQLPGIYFSAIAGAHKGQCNSPIGGPSRQRFLAIGCSGP
jgi:hypothetical protein